MHQKDLNGTLESASKILDLAQRSTAELVSILLTHRLSLGLGEHDATSVAKHYGLDLSLFIRLLNFASHKEIITWSGSKSFMIQKMEADQGATEVIRFLARTESHSLPSSLQVSDQAKKLGLHLGIWNETNQGMEWSLSLNEVLSHSSSDSMLAWVKNFAEISTRLFSPDCLLKTLQTGQPQWNLAFGIPAETPFDLKVFDLRIFENLMRAMHQANVREAELLGPFFDLTTPSKILDVGGASGALGRHLCFRYPFIIDYQIYELASAIPIYEKIASEHTTPELLCLQTVRYRPGDFLKHPDLDWLAGLGKGETFDKIILGWILHDWLDEKAELILRKIKKHLKPGGKLFVLEAVLPDDRQGPVTMLDLTMLAQTGGKERTLAEFNELFIKSGLRLVSATSTLSRRQILIGEHL